MIIYACGKNDYANQNEMTFRIDSNLLGEKYVNQTIGFIFSPPRDCKPLPESIVDKVKDTLKTTYSSVDFLKIDPVKFFLNQETQFACLISILQDLTESDTVISNYQQALKNQNQNSQIKQTKFFYNGFTIYQTLIMTETTIQFKLVIPQPSQKSFQIDYIIPNSIYVEKIEAIESSIGSIKKI